MQCNIYNALAKISQNSKSVKNIFTNINNSPKTCKIGKRYSNLNFISGDKTILAFDDNNIKPSTMLGCSVVKI